MNFLFENSMQLRNQQKTIAWTWHLRLNHCRIKMINQLRNKKGIEIIQSSKTLKTVKCIICVISKMHRLIQKTFINKIIKSYKILYFDLIIYNCEFNDIICIIHFINELIFFNWVFSLNDHKEKTLIFVFKNLINQCDYADMITNSIIKIIRTGQKTSIDKWLKNWILQQGIKWEWSTKNTSKQNRKSKRFDALLIEKARCIELHAKLPEELYLEFYFAAMHFINRTLTQLNQWNSSLVIIQKLTNQSIKNKISHLRIFGCKTYSLLKNIDVPLAIKRWSSKSSSII